MSLRLRSLIETAKAQIYVSRSNDPFLNLSIEHFLLQKTPPDSVVLFLYTNRPCVVVGRNQNIWLEVNLRMLNRGLGPATGQPQKGIDLVRRRSGGGTVFHDEGNINYSVICPSPLFTRDKHAEMVTRAIRKLNRRARVNERHDIVLDQGRELSHPDSQAIESLHVSSYDVGPAAVKVSGSAYKMTRNRTLHHGTCLLASPNISTISQYLRAPSRPYLHARGVESVRSPVGNILQGIDGLSSEISARFERSVIKQFVDLYKIDEKSMSVFSKKEYEGPHSIVDHTETYASAQIRPDIEDEPEIQKGIAELRSGTWIYGQTPQFSLSSYPIPEDERGRPPLPEYLPSSCQVYLKSRSGVITESKISMSKEPALKLEEENNFQQLLNQRKIYEVASFQAYIQNSFLASRSSTYSQIGIWLDEMLGKYSS